MYLHAGHEIYNASVLLLALGACYFKLCLLGWLCYGLTLYAFLTHPKLKPLHFSGYIKLGTKETGHPRRKGMYIYI